LTVVGIERSRNGARGDAVPLRGFRDLRVWQASIELVELVYLVTRTFPRDQVYGLCSQMQRAAVSVPSNIAEGQSREHLKEYLHHLSMAQGSLGELETQVEICHRLAYISPEQHDDLLVRVTTIARQLRALRAALERRLYVRSDDA
jgi:four helix bundle protein